MAKTLKELTDLAQKIRKKTQTTKKQSSWKGLVDDAGSKSKVVSSDFETAKYFLRPDTSQSDYNDLKTSGEFIKAMANNVGQKAMSEGTDTAGGYSVPAEFIRQIVRMQRDIDGLSNIVRNVQTSSDQVDFTLQTGGTSVNEIAENTAITKSDSSVARVSLTLRKIAGLSEQSLELFNDSATNPSMAQMVIQELADDLVVHKNQRIISGSGSGQAQGLTAFLINKTDSTAAKRKLKYVFVKIGEDVGTATTSFTRADLWKIVAALDPAYNRPRNVFLMSRKTFQNVFGSESDKQGTFLGTALNTGQPTRMQIFGYRVYVSDQITDNYSPGNNMATDSKGGVIMFGDPQEYAAATNGNREVATDTSGDRFDKYMIGFRVLERWDGRPLRVNGWSTGWFDAS